MKEVAGWVNRGEGKRHEQDDSFPTSNKGQVTFTGDYAFTPLNFSSDMVVSKHTCTMYIHGFGKTMAKNV